MLYLKPIVAVLLAFLMVGGHWGTLQVVAWSGMLAEYSRESSWMTAVDRTFGGDAPCRLCEAIEEGRQSEQTQVLEIEVSRLHAILSLRAEAPEDLADQKEPTLHGFPEDWMAGLMVFNRPTPPPRS